MALQRASYLATSRPEHVARRSARWRMLTLRLRDATTRPQCSLFVLWPSKATLTRNTNWRYFMTTAWASRRTRSAHYVARLVGGAGQRRCGSFSRPVARRMSPAQREEAQKLAHEWKPNHFLVSLRRQNLKHHDALTTGRRDENGHYCVAWCFADPALADAFASEFRRNF
jgi:hypothetical protein